MSVFGKPFESPLEKSAAHANTINRNVIAQQFLQHRIVVIHIEFGPVHAIRNQENNLAAFRGRDPSTTEPRHTPRRPALWSAGPLMFASPPAMFGASPIAEWPLIEGPLLMAGLSSATAWPPCVRSRNCGDWRLKATTSPCSAPDFMAATIASCFHPCCPARTASRTSSLTLPSGTPSHGITLHGEDPVTHIDRVRRRVRVPQRHRGALRSTVDCDRFASDPLAGCPAAALRASSLFAFCRMSTPCSPRLDRGGAWW